MSVAQLRGPGRVTFEETIRRATDVARERADDVDRDARFPDEALAALRGGGALGALVDPALGGLGVAFESVCAACFDLARGCASTGMVFAMHQIQVACIARHADQAAFFRGYLERLAGEQRLIASATSEVGTGGDLRSSIASLEVSDDGRGSFTKNAPTVSYALHADDLLTTVRRSPDSDPSDQVLVLTSREESGLEQVSPWDTLGMRGTCSPGFAVHARFGLDQVVSGPFSPICTETMVPFSHILWAHVWLGIAADAVERAQSFMRAGARVKPGEPPPTALRFSRLVADYASMRAVVHGAVADYARVMDEPGREQLQTLGSTVRLNTLKLAASEAAAGICRDALQIVGMAGYRNGTPYSVGRNIRDSLSCSLMIANERIHHTNALLLQVHQEV
jgi:acyl-CoA dehydrogenase